MLCSLHVFFVWISPIDTLDSIEAARVRDALTDCRHDEIVLWLVLDWLRQNNPWHGSIVLIWKIKETLPLKSLEGKQQRDKKKLLGDVCKQQIKRTNIDKEASFSNSYWYSNTDSNGSVILKTN